VSATGTPSPGDPQQSVLLVLNDSPYGTERSYNALRLAMSLARDPGVALRVFLMADAAYCAQRGQQTPQGYHNIERMLGGLGAKQVPIGACGSCMDARGLPAEALVEGVRRSSMAELTAWTIAADKVISF